MAGSRARHSNGPVMTSFRRCGDKSKGKMFIAKWNGTIVEDNRNSLVYWRYVRGIYTNAMNEMNEMKISIKAGQKVIEKHRNSTDLWAEFLGARSIRWFSEVIMENELREGESCG